MADVLFKGYFDLSTALNEFGKFCKDVEFRLKKVYENVNQDKQAAGFGVFGTTKADVQKAEKEIKGAQDRVANGFINLAIRSYALHQVGNLLNQAVTQPVLRLGEAVLDTTLKFDTLEQLLTQRAGKSLEEVNTTFDTIGKTAKLRNLDLDTTVTLYSRLFESTRGAIDDKLFEKVAGGLSQVLTTIESSERRAFFGQIQDVLGGGNVANLERTLSLAPALKTVFDEVRAGNEALTDQQALIESFGRLAALPQLDDLTTKVKNIQVALELLLKTLSKIYKDEIERIVDFLLNKVIPMMDKLLKQFQQAPPLLQNITAVIVALAAALGPILGTLGTLVLLFPNAVAEAAFVGKITAFLTRLPALLNPITAIITALVAILIKAYQENAGWFRDTFQILVDTLSTTFLNVLKAIYETVVNLVSIVVNFYRLLDSIIPITETIGTLASGLVLIIAQILSLLNLLAVLPATLGLIADILNGDIEVGFQRFTVSMLKMLDALGPLSEFLQWLFGVNLDEKIKEAQQELDRLEKTTGKYNETTEETEKRQAAIQKALENEINSVTTMTHAIEAQTKAIDAQILKNRQLSEERSQQFAKWMRENRLADQQEFIGSFDLTSPEGRQAARDEQSRYYGMKITGADAEAKARIQREMRKALEMQRETVVEILEKEKGKLDQQTQDLYFQYGDKLRQMLLGPFDITNENVQKMIFDEMDKIVTKSKGSIPQILNFIKYLQNEKTLINEAYRVQISNTEERTKAEKELADARRKLEKEIQEAQEDEQKREKARPIKREVERIDDRISFLEGQLGKTEEFSDNLTDIDIVEGQINDIIQRLKNNDTKRKEKLKELASIEAKSKADYDDAISKIDAESDRRQEALERMSTDAKNKVYDKILGGILDRRENVNELLTQLIDMRQRTIDLARDAGISATDEVGLLNRSLDILFQGLTEDKLSTLQRTLASTANLLDALTPQIAEPLRQAFETINKIGRGDMASPEGRKKLFEQAETLRKILQNFLGSGEGARLTDNQKAQMELFIQHYVKFIDALKQGQDVLEKKVDIGILNKETQLVQLEIQRQILDGTERELELTREIYEQRKKTGDLQFGGGLKGFGKQLLDIISGGRLSDYEFEKAMLEQKMAAAKMDLEIALLRLEIEKEITLMRLKQSGMSDADLQKVREQYDDLILKTRTQGELNQILIQNQIDSLSYLSGGLGDMLFQAIAKGLEALFGLKDKPKVTVLDDEGKEQEIEDDEEDKDKQKSDAIQDITDKSKEAGGWLDKLDTKYKKIGATAYMVGKAIMQMNDLSIKSIRNAIAATLEAIAAEAAAQALKFAAIALSALVFQDYSTAAKAGLAAAKWAAVAVAAKVGAALIGTGDGSSAGNSESSGSSSAGVPSGAYSAERDTQILKQQALSVRIVLDIRTDDGIIVKKTVQALNQNTELTNLTMNQQEGWNFPSAP